MNYTPHMDVAPEDKCENVRREICLKSLPASLTDAKLIAASSAFLNHHLPQSLIDWFCWK